MDLFTACNFVSLVTPSGKEEGSGHAAAIELSPRQKLAVTNEIHTFASDVIGSNYVTMCLVDVRIYYLMALFSNCIPW